MGSAAWMLAIAASCFAQAAEPKAAPASCRSAELAAVADRVAAAFDSHPFVFLGSTHGGKKPHDFLLCLLSRPAFHERAGDVLVEWANPVHQKILDRYLVELAPVPADELKQVWFDSDRPQLWARLPQIPEFFAAVRAVNARLEPARRIRVLGGSDTVNWKAVRTADDIAIYPFKTNWAAHVVTEHFAPKGDPRLLVVYGDAHIDHNGGTLMADIEAKLDRSKLFSVGTIADAAESELVGRFGNPARPFFLAARDSPRSGPYPKGLYVRSDPLASHVDALVYLGPEPERNLADTVDFTEAQREELRRREAIKGDLRRSMQLRLGRRDAWFRTHPEDIPPRP